MTLKIYKWLNTKRDEAYMIFNDIMVSRIEINRKMADVGLWDIYFNNTKMFIVICIYFYYPVSTMFSYFKGYLCKKVNEVNMNLIQSFLYYTCEIIVNSDLKDYNYL